MPNPVDIYLDDFHLHSLTDDLPTRVSYPLQGLDAPDVRVSSYDNPGSHGQTVSNALYGGRLVTMTGSVRGDSVDEYRANRLALQRAMSLQNDTAGFPITHTLKVDLGGGTAYTLPVVVSKFQCPETAPSYAKFQLELRATQWYLEEESIVWNNVLLPQPGGASFPWSFPLSFAGGGGGMQPMVNWGTVTAYPTIYISGPVINPVLTNQTTGQSLALNITLVAGDQLIIDTKARTIIQGGSTNKIGTLVTGSTFWGLIPGENDVTYAANQYDTSQAIFGWYPPIGGL